MRESGANPEWPTFSSFLSKFFRSRNFNKSYNFRTLFSHLFPDFYLPVREGNGGAECKKRREIDLCDGSVQKKPRRTKASHFREKRGYGKKGGANMWPTDSFVFELFFLFCAEEKGNFRLVQSRVNTDFCACKPIDMEKPRYP